MTVSDTTDIASVVEVVDGNEAAARAAHLMSEVIAIYPITPASPMGELSDAWSAAGRQNLWGVVPEVVEMQSEAGAAGTLHGAVTKGALGTTFTSSQGLLLMIPNMFKIAGELTPAVIHVAARTIATHALSIFGDHSDVMAVRSTGWAMLASGSVQEAADLAVVAHTASLESRVPVLHFFDGFRTSHELAKVHVPGAADIDAVLDDDWLTAHRLRGLDPDRPVLRGSAQNPDVFFQAREAANPFYDAAPAIMQRAMDRLAARVGRAYHLVDYTGAPDADRVVVIMGSGAGAVEETVERLRAEGQRVGMLRVRLYRPFPIAELVAALPPTVRSLGVLDRTKEPGAPGEPLYLDVVAALSESDGPHPRVVGGRYGLSSKEFTPAMANAVFDELAAERPRNHFTVGIADDVTHRSLAVDDSFTTDAARWRAVFFGLGADGTVGANKQSAEIVGAGTDLHVQGYFVYDSKKSGSMTVSHLRFDDEPIRSTYLVSRANFVGCHQFGLLDRVDVLDVAEPGATLLLNSPYGPDDVWEHLPREVQDQILERGLDLWVIDANAVARDAGLAGRINTIMQTCFFRLCPVMPLDEATAAIRASIVDAYGKRGGVVVDANLAAVGHALDALHRVDLTGKTSSAPLRRPVVAPDAPDFVQRITAMMMAGRGDLLPVSALPVDGTFPTGTARYEKRGIAAEIPIWDPDICIDCGRCAIVCPHAAILMKVYEPGVVGGDDAPAEFRSKDFRSRDLPGMRLTIQVAPDDCTGCGVCVDVCPAKSKSEVKHKAINMEPIAPHLERERTSFSFFGEIAPLPTGALDPASVKGAQVREPLFEFSGACAGCGETPYLKLLTQLFGDRLLIANATGCSSIYGGNLPTTPWGTDRAGRGPAWSNSLFEDNAEFGLGIRLGLDAQVDTARTLLRELAPHVGGEIAGNVLAADQGDDAGVAAQRVRVEGLRDRLLTLAQGAGGSARAARSLLEVAGALVRKSVWIVGGDGWAYDIGAGGLDHVLATGRNVNVLVLDTEVYSNTGGQASKATPRGAVAKFAASGSATPKKDLGILSTTYGDVYVAQVAVGANDIQTVKAFVEAEAWAGPSLVIAYSTCIAHGIDMSKSMSHQRDAVRSGHWPLYRYHPGHDEHTHPFQLDSKAPTMPLAEFAAAEGRYAVLARSDPEHARELLVAAQADVDERWRLYEQLAGIERTAHDGFGHGEPPVPEDSS